MESIERIAWRRLGLFDGGSGEHTPALCAGAVAELAHVGVRVANPWEVHDSAVERVVELCGVEADLRGEVACYAPLFAGFPDKLPSFDDGQLRFLAASCRLIGRESISNEDIAEAMDFSMYGWWPASSIPQDAARARIDRELELLAPGDSSTQWREVRAVARDELLSELAAYVGICLGSAAALRDDVWDDLRELIGVLGAGDIDARAVRFVENRTLVTKLVWDQDPAAIVQLGLGPDDVLRLFACLTDGDVSLSKPIRWPRLSRRERKIVVTALERSERLGDIFRRRDLWLAIERGLHVGEYDAPRLIESFGRLRQSRHDRSSMRSRVETCLARMDSEGDVAYGEAIAILGTEAPTVLVRELRRLLSLAGSPRAVEVLVEELRSCADRVPLRVLMAARAQLADNGATYPRAAFSKSGAALIIDREPGHLAVEDEVADGVCEVLDEAVERRCAQLGSWSDERVWIDPVLDDVLVPDGLRSTSGGLVTVERGSRLPLDDDNVDVVRLFVHWKEAEQRTDLDLSAIVLDDDFNVVSHVDWTNLTEFGMTHSGDITSSEVGAEEFIDVDLVKMSELARVGGGRYVAMCVLRFAGETFDELDEGCAGWMLRKDTTSEYKTFDVSTVSNAFALSGRARTAVPFMIDVVRGEAVYLDIALWGAPMACLSRDGGAVSALVRAAVGRAWTKMSLTDLALYHALSRGADVVEDYEDATITFGTDAQCSYDGLHPERILAELL